jgi:hypothetical protein
MFRADIVAVFDRDPATDRFLEPVLYYKGFHAIQTPARMALVKGRKDLPIIFRAALSGAPATSTTPRSAASSSSIMPPASLLARLRRSATTCRCCTA